MATMSMHAGRSIDFSRRPASRASQARPAATVRAASHSATPYVQQALGVTSRFGLALLPFSFLAWMFVAH